MISLVKSELVKIFHKKSLKVLSIVVAGMLLCSFLVSFFVANEISTSDYLESQYKSLEESLDDYDLNDKSEAKAYAEDYAYYKKIELLLDYPDNTSPEYYYIENTIEPVLNNMYYVKYVTKNEYEYNEYKELYDSYVLKLNNFDWKGDLKKERQDYLEERKVLKMSLNSEDVDNEEVKKQIEVLDIQISAIDYRLEYEIPYANTDASMTVDDYVNEGILYVNLEKDESLYETKEELNNKREIEGKFKVASYKLENGIIESADRTDLMLVLESFYEYVDMFILIAMFIIITSVIADEFSKGTIKQLLIKPFTRNEILLSKIIASVIATIIFAIGYLALNTILYCFDYRDFGVLLSDMVVYDFGKQEILNINFMVYCLIRLVAILSQYLIIFFFVFLMCVITTNAVGSLAAGFGLFIGVDMVSMLLTQKQLAYLPFGCWDFSPYLFGGFSLNKYASLPLSLVVCSITLIILVSLSFIIFKRKDIKNQ